jgi:hypothetical protein
MARTSAVQADVSRDCVTMTRSAIIIALIAFAIGSASHLARASEVPALQLGEALAHLGQADRVRVEQALRRESFTLFGDVRRKGQIIIVLAVQQGAPWRLVIDGQSGEIIGRRPLAETVALPR